MPSALSNPRGFGAPRAKQAPLLIVPRSHEKYFLRALRGTQITEKEKERENEKREKKMLFLDSLSALSKRALFPSYIIAPPSHRHPPSSRASKSRMTSVYIYAETCVHPLARAMGDKGGWEEEMVRTRVCESAITTGRTSAQWTVSTGVREIV